MHQYYVFLSDVTEGPSSVADPSPYPPSWISQFMLSRWFTRGWTLQELIAPRFVQFFSAEWQPLGDKISLINEVCDKTGISPKALRGSELDWFSTEEKMAWASERNTKRGEDLAYSLLGLFGIHMPLIYGEGKINAMLRLEKKVLKAEGKFESLRTVIREDNIAEAERLLAGGPELKTPFKQSFEILQSAVASGSTKMTRLVLKFGACPYQENGGKTALSVACDAGQYDIAEELWVSIWLQSTLDGIQLSLFLYAQTGFLDD